MATSKTKKAIKKAPPKAKAPPPKKAGKPAPGKPVVSKPVASKGAAPQAKQGPGRPHGAFGGAGRPGGNKPAVGADGKKPVAATRAPARTPERAEELKAKIGALATATGQIRALKRTLHKSFHEIGHLLGEIQQKKLYEVKGYGSFEAFLEREIDLGKQLSIRILKISNIFQRDAAVSYGLDKSVAALAALEGDQEAQAPTPAPAPTAAGTRSPIPPHKQ